MLFNHGQLVSSPEVAGTYGVLLLLDLEGLAVLEGPLDDVGLGGGTLDEVALLELRPELAEVLELDQVPDVAERSIDDGRLADGGGGGNGRHCEDEGLDLWSFEVWVSDCVV